MKKQIKRITAFAAAVAMAAAFTFPAEIGDSFFGFGNVIVASAESSGEWVYTVNADQTVTITGYQGWDGAVEIPAVIDGKSVTSIGNGAFRNCPGLESITIPYTVTSIGDGAFRNCSGLESITIPDGVTFIGDDAFRNCSGLTSINIPDRVTSIGDFAFMDCSGLTSITIGGGVTSIGYAAFGGCTGLTSITIPSSVTSIGDAAFSRCTGLTDITVDSNNPYYCSESGVLFNKNKTKFICYPAGKTDISYTIPDGVTSIGHTAFEACTGLTSITIPDGVTSIGDYAFERCTGLESITIPDSVNSIGYEAFDRCTKLTSIYIPDGEISIGFGAIPSTAARITYIVNSDGSVTITKIELTNGQNTIDIPAAINGKKVIAVEEEYRSYIGNHTCASSTPATCIKKAACGICGQDYYGDHNISHHDAAAHTCTADGTIEYWECSVCGKYFSDDNGTTEITNIVDPNDPAPGHNWDTAYESNETHHWHNCTNANCPINENNQKGGYDVHTPGADWESDNDENHYHICSVCSGKADVTPHSYDSGAITTPATETTDGVKTYTCSVCNHTKTETIPKFGHTHSISEDYSKDETGHWHACSDCDEKVDFEAHTEDSGTVTVQPTETSIGVMTYYCSVCGYEMRTEEIPAITPEHTHSYGTEWNSDSTSHWHECSCGEKTDTAQHISNGGVVTVQPTAYTTGVRVYSCSVCGHIIRTETIPATGSNYFPTYPTYPTNPAVSSPSVFTESLAVKAESDGSTAALSWDKAENADKYCVYQYKDGKYVKIKTTTDTSVMLKGLKNGETYKFLVRYSIGSKLSPMTYSYKITVKVYYKPIVSASAEKDSVTLKWNAVPNAEKYAIYKYADGKAVKLAETEKRAAKIIGLTPDTEYQYIVSAYVDGKWTTMLKSDIVTVRTKAE